MQKKILLIKTLFLYSSKKFVVSKFIKHGIKLLILLILPAFSSCNFSVKDLKVVYLRCEYKENPIIDVLNPRLSWILESDIRGQKQTAYRILVATSPEKLSPGEADLWDSQKVPTDQTYQIRYEGKPLHSEEVCYWKAMSWDKDGNPGSWSEYSKWEMGLLNKDEWKGKWIGLDLNNLGIGKVYHLPPAPYLRKQISIKGKIKKAHLYVTALGLYQFYINGKRIGKDFLTPGWADYNKRVYYQTYDVTDNLKVGINALGSILSYGWYAGYIGSALLNHHAKVKGFYGDVPALLAQIKIEYENGTSEIFSTDTTWKLNYGPIVESDILDGETYDARKEFGNWKEPGFDDSAWKKAEIIITTKKNLECLPGIPVQITGTIKPESVNEINGKYIFNMGQNFAGVVKLKIKGDAGDTIIIRYGEMLYPDGSLMTENLRMARATDTYILKGKPEGEEWEPSFTYHGFQYVEVSGLKEKPKDDLITGLVLGSNTPRAGTFECSDSMVNKLYSNIVWTQRSNFVDIPTDCPQRDERLGWTGDAQVYVSSATLNMDIAAFYSKWLVDLKDSQLENGAYPFYVPSPPDLGSSSFSPGWMEAGIICPYQIYKTYDDTVVVNKFWPNMSRFMEFLEKRSIGKYYFPEGAFADINPKGGFGDWLSIGKKTSPDLLATMYFGYCASLMAKMAQAAGRNSEAEHYADMFKKIKKAFYNHYVSPDGKLKCDEAAYGNGDGYVDGDRGFTGNTQTAYANAIYMNMLPDSLIPKAGENLNELIEKNNGYLTTGFLGVKPLLPALSKTGNSETAYQLLLNKNYPSWGYEVNNGATTMWERWDSYTKGKGFEDAGMNSFSHYSFGSVCEWMFEYMAGIKSKGTAYKHIIIKPDISKDKISFVNASLNTMNGKIVSSWKVEGNKLLMHIVIPVNTMAEVYVPSVESSTIKENGIDIKESPDIKIYKFENGIQKVNVGSGNYNFESIIKI
jgi:alpha-L-rhamnosidase